MAKIGVCAETFFTDLPYEQRLRRIAALGFTRYELWFHDKRFDGARLHDEPKDFDRLAALNDTLGLSCTDFIFNHPDAGVKAALIDAKDRSLILDSLGAMIDRARKINCRAFISGAGNVVAGLARDAAMENMIETLRLAARVCEKEGITLLLEPFNTKVDHPQYFLDDPEECLAVLKAVNSPSVRMLYDIYHMQIMGGDIVSFIRRNISWIGHFHVAGVPGRHEPRESELNYPFILKELDRLGYAGNVGLEYWPTIEPGESLRQTVDWLGTGAA
jgi:hydroxypyruvate isomerase